MKKELVVKVFFAVLVLAVFIGGVLIISEKSKTSELRRELAEQKQIVLANTEIYKKDIAENEAKIAELMGAVDSANTVIEFLKEKERDRDGNIAALNKKLNDARTDAERVPILVSIVDEWKGKCDLLTMEIGKKDEQISSLKVALNLQVNISDDYKSMWTQEKQLRERFEGAFNGMVKKEKKRKLVDKVLLAAGIGGLIYGAVK